jgi:hypothetical protein
VLTVVSDLEPLVHRSPPFVSFPLLPRAERGCLARDS